MEVGALKKTDGRKLKGNHEENVHLVSKVPAI